MDEEGTPVPTLMDPTEPAGLTSDDMTPVTDPPPAAPSAAPDTSGAPPPPAAPPAAPMWRPPDTSAEDAEAKADREAARAAQEKATAAGLEQSDQAKQAAADLKAAQGQADQVAAQVPDQGAIYTASLKAAAPIATLMATNGKAMGLTGGMMLGALTGLIKGMNAGSASTVEESWKKYQAANDAMQRKIGELLNYNKLMMDSYAGRADAYQKAADAARRMAGDVLDEKKQKIAMSIDQFRLMEQARDHLENQTLRLQQLTQNWQEAKIRDAQREETIRIAMQRANTQQKQQIMGLKTKLDNYTKQINEIQRAEGQLRNDPTFSGDTAKARFQEMDAQISQLTGMRNAVADQISQVASAAQTNPEPSAPPTAAQTAPPVTTQNPQASSAPAPPALVNGKKVKVDITKAPWVYDMNVGAYVPWKQYYEEHKAEFGG